MKLILKDYLLQLKEKDELDLLLCDLLLQSGYVTDTVPKTGNRQFGVDIQAHKENELLLCVVKQGNINRKVWSDGQNSVEQSLNEILNVYLRNLAPRDQKRKFHIAVITNGVLEEAVKLDWDGFADRNQMWNGKKIDYDFWGIDCIVEKAENNLFDEYLFSSDLQTAMRKALYFVGEPDYKNVFFEHIINVYIEKTQNYIDGKGSNKHPDKQLGKLLSGLHLAVQMIAQYASRAKCYKIAVMVSEYLLISYWKYLHYNQLFEKKYYITWLIKFCRSYEKWCSQYYLAVRMCCEKKDAFPVYDIVEQRVLLYEVAGFLASYAYYLYEAGYDEARQVVHTIICLIDNNPQFWYAPYDGHIGIVTMIYRLVMKTGTQDDIYTLMNIQTMRLMNYYKLLKKYPTPTDSFQDAIDIEMCNIVEEYETSGLWGYILLWIGVLREEGLYGRLKNFLDGDLEKVTKCVWFLRENEEQSFYGYGAMKAGEGIELKTEKDFHTFVEKIDYIFAQYKEECFSYEKYSFSALEMLVCRYYGYVPRVVVEDGQEKTETQAGKQVLVF